MKDLTSIAEDDFVLKEKKRLGEDAAKPETVGIETESRVREKRERYERCAPVANDILEEARVALAVRFRFLDTALWRMPLEPSFDIYGIASDGIKLYYDPEYVVKRFKLSPNEVVRDVIHCLFHCIFKHPFMLYSVLREPWDVACDIAIESMLLDLVGDAFPSNMDRRTREALKVLGAQVCGVITAERLYRFFSNEGSHIDLRSLAPMVFHDTHGLWYGDDSSGNAQGTVSAVRQEFKDHESGQLPTHDGEKTLEDTQGASETLSSQGSDGDEGSTTDKESELDVDGAGDDDAADIQAEKDLADEWGDLGRHMQIELESYLSRQGDTAGSLIAALKAVNREEYDYAKFLSRFATLHERMCINSDEFDYIYYTYGLNHYGNMPLIEPLEYREARAVHDFVIAIDTSESVSGDLVQAFIRKTYNILKQVENFHDRVNVHIVQCDASVQKDTKITSLDQLDRYIEAMELCGFGGTDFRPVFEHVNVLIEKREFTDLRGIVYFTDGQGMFPRKRPAYDAMFVFLDDGYSDPEIPPWALKTILRERDLP